MVLRPAGALLTSGWAITERHILHRSPVWLTRYTPAGLIDEADISEHLGPALDAQLGEGARPDTGALIVTGDAARRENAPRIAAAVAHRAGDFVCVVAGPAQEALLAAHGSGAVDLSRPPGAPGRRVLNIDVGGGTTKFALCVGGAVEAVAAIHVGARLLAVDGDRRVQRRNPHSEPLLRQAGVAPGLGWVLDAPAERRLATVGAALIAGIAEGKGLPRWATSLWVTPPLPRSGRPDAILFSGGVAEYVYGRERGEFGDLGPALGHSLAAWSARFGSLVLEAEGIRATVIGASQYTLQVSSDTIYVSDPALLPMHAVPAVPVHVNVQDDAPAIAAAIRQALRTRAREGPMALAFGEVVATHPALLNLARGIASGAAGHRPLVCVFQGDVGLLVGRLLRAECGWSGGLAVIDGISLGDFDFLDLNPPLEGTAAVPVVVKSLVFDPSLHSRG
jgi:ethanolamine utilization protein EutA